MARFWSDADDPEVARGSFPTDDAALKLLYLALNNAGLRWRRPAPSCASSASGDDAMMNRIKAARMIAQCAPSPSGPALRRAASLLRDLTARHGRAKFSPMLVISCS
jgi:hypothetical protein